MLSSPFQQPSPRQNVLASQIQDAQHVGDGWATVLLSGFGILALPTGGLFYGLMLLPYNNRLLQLVHRLAADPDSLTNAKSLFRWSILYLFGICLLLILSRSALAAHLDQQMIAMLMQMGVA